MDKTEKLTIAIPVFNRTDFFNESLRSALNQTVSCKVIVVDNASNTSYFKDTCDEFGVDYYRNGSNIGMFGNWNKCVHLAKTEYILILGDDDILKVNYVEEFVKALSRYEFDIYFVNFQILWDDGSLSDWYSKDNFHVDTDPLFGFFNGIKLLSNASTSLLSIPSVFAAVKREILMKKPFYENFHSSNDWLWYYTSCTEYNFFGNNIFLGIYRKHKNGDSKINHYQTYHFAYPIIYFKISQELEKNKLYNLSQKALDKAVAQWEETIKVGSVIFYETLTKDNNGLYFNAYYDFFKVLPRKSFSNLYLKNPFLLKVMFLKIKPFQKKLRKYLSLYIKNLK